MGLSLRLSILLVLVSVSGYELRGQETLSSIQRHDLQRLGETWNLLDQAARNIWPGWSGYRTLPFLFLYPDGTEMLVGHPAPPSGFRTALYDSAAGVSVCINTEHAIARPLTPPLIGGGGPSPFGTFNGHPVLTVQIHLSSPPQDSSHAVLSGRSRVELASETQVLIYLHELFHCFQSTLYTWQYGNLQYNTDANYAVFADVEGQALERAYTDTTRAREYLKDFIVARELKRRSMDSTEQLQESEEELMEGTATYAEIKAVEAARNIYRTAAAPQSDPFFFAFADADSFLLKRLANLRLARENSTDAISKFYSFGAFQALALDHLLPSWRAEFFQKKRMMDEMIADVLHLTSGEKRKIAEGFSHRYDLDRLTAKHTAVINKRAVAFDLVEKREGTTYIINFKPTREFPALSATGQLYSLGLMMAYPEGIGQIKIADVLLTGKKSPMMLDQLYYAKWIDTETPAGKKGYTITFGRKEGDIYDEAVLTTGGFVLKAPKIEISEQPHRTKITVLSKVKE